MRKKSEDKTKMIELAKKFIDKECIIRTFNNSQFTGVIKEVTEGAVLIERSGITEAVNLDFAVSIMEHPRNKKGKKKIIW